MRTPPHPSRRALLAGVGVVAVAGPLTACDLPGPGGATPVDEDSREAARQGEDPDAEHVRAAAARSSELLALLTATAGAHPRLRDRLGPLEACHRAHLEVLGRVDDAAPGTDPSAAPTPAPSPGSAGGSTPPRALRRVVSRETALADELLHLAGSADSGVLARLLATMAAGVHMHLEALQEDAS